MRFVWKGRIKDMQELPKGNLPSNAVKYKEPENTTKLNLVAILFTIPVLLLVGVGIFIKSQLDANFIFPRMYDIRGFLLAFISVLPHEYLHGLGFPKEAEVQCWYKIESMIAFVVSTYPTSKRRFIYLSLLPNIIFGFIPFILWVVIPFQNIDASNILFCFSSFSLLIGAGDYMNVYNTITQVPKGAITQLSGFNSYWYLPEDKQETMDRVSNL